jgi:nicotinate-nucleotide--dimethylbenzimidazole phosphoribosyltransferase
MAATRERLARSDAAGSLGRLGALAVWLAGVTGDDRPRARARVVVVAADHAGAAAASAGPALRALAAGHTALPVLAAEAGADVVLVDAGVHGGAGDVACVRPGLAPARDLAAGAALSVGEVAAAVDCGRDLAAAAAAEGVTLLVGGDLATGAATGATCLAAALTGRAGEAAAWLPAFGGPDDLERERRRAAAAIAHHAPQGRGPLGLLRRLGGGEASVLCGLALGAGEHGLGVVCDGLVATAAAAVAVAIEPDLRSRLVAGGRAPGPAHAALLEHLGLEPVLDLGVARGDGSGALAAVAVLRLAAALSGVVDGATPSAPAPGR